MTETLTLYTNPMSRGRIARWMLEEVGCSYETVVLDYGTTMKDADYLAVNPMGKVPAIKHGDTVVTEAAAICAYLADAFPDAGLAPPPGNAMRGPYYRWLFFGAGPVEAAVTAKSLGLLAPPERAANAGYGRFEDVLDALESAARSASPYLCGEQFTAADLYLGAQIGWGMMFGTIEKRPAFEEYHARIAERPAAKRAAALDDALMAQVQQSPQQAS
ncbi:glutathione S-transferase family protein [Sphingosinicella sp. BN140058]|uniref:glutathione S-transferase family protein n=1 Tax=Sphingosinicella sp. BN140058 TaxID=1892855 RepID=UPI00101065DD|nr:glutathione S-transferase family protein [Sphingosinicella sp. BN140058]QAY75947.1 glutathione S-transferase family protein [Sphingosinicella sp. BN140058]